MESLAKTWMTTTRRHFPDHPIYLCTGGDAPPHHGAHFGEQCRIAASVGGGVRITNEASRYPHNFACTRWVTSSGRFHGAYTGIEPAGGVNEFGVTCRIFNTTVSGANNLHFYEQNIVHHRETVDSWHASFDAIRMEEPVVHVAYLYPDTSVMLADVDTYDVFAQVGRLRDITDLDYLDDDMIEAGALDRFRVLIIALSSVVEQATLARIDAWLESGGLLVILGDTPIESVEGTSWNPVRQQVIRANLFTMDAHHDRAVAKYIREALARNGYDLIDGELDGVYMSEVSGRILTLNHGTENLSREVSLTDGRILTVAFPANSITEIFLE